jgi:hypothetical protein
MIDVKKDANTLELIIWIDENTAIVQKLTPKRVAELKAKIDVLSEELKRS